MHVRSLRPRARKKSRCTNSPTKSQTSVTSEARYSHRNPYDIREQNDNQSSFQPMSLYEVTFVSLRMTSVNRILIEQPANVGRRLSQWKLSTTSEALISLSEQMFTIQIRITLSPNRGQRDKRMSSVAARLPD